MTKRTIGLAAAFLCLASAALVAAPATVTYTEGDTVLKLKSGKQQDAQIGDKMNTGDTIRTGADGAAELTQGAVTLKVASGTVFTLMENSSGGKTSSVLSVALGSVKYRYDKLTGTEPQVRTNGAVAGVRGTEFTVYSGADGSTLIAVDSGAVTVESEGQSVDLAASEGVEVPLGKPPLPKAAMHTAEIDYASWNAGKFAALLADPLGAMDGIEKEMASYESSVADFAARFAEATKNLEAERAKRDQIGKDQGADAAKKYDEDTVTPLGIEAGHLFLNTRYYALAALSLRRYVAGRLYVSLKAQSISSPDDATWSSFVSRYAALLDSFEHAIAPQLTAGDI